MGLGSIFGGTDEFNKGIELCKQFCRNEKLIPEQCMRKNTDPIEEKKDIKQDFLDKCVSQVNPAETLSKIQKDIINTIENCKNVFQGGDFLQCYKSYYQTAYNILDFLKSKSGRSEILTSAKESIERAISDIPLYNEDEKKCLLFRNIFDEILKMKA